MREMVRVPVRLRHGAALRRPPNPFFALQRFRAAREAGGLRVQLSVPRCLGGYVVFFVTFVFFRVFVVIS
jgi:hypothetical protein